jgi:hypothetical protein
VRQSVTTRVSILASHFRRRMNDSERIGREEERRDDEWKRDGI